MISRASYMNSPYIGVFSVANDNFAFVPNACPESFSSVIEETLKVDAVPCSIAGTGLLGIFLSINNNTAVVSDIVEKEELAVLKDHFSEVIVIAESFTAVGNLMAMNDKGIVCSPVLRGELDLPKTHYMTIAGSNLVGSYLYANNKGFITHRDTDDIGLNELQEALKVKGNIGTVNMGDPHVATGIVGNTNGIVAGTFTSGPELNRIDDIFVFEQE
ncbi:MAG: translation initiation factor IF-6 [Candidatus Micrarchaeota archaeon]